MLAACAVLSACMTAPPPLLHADDAAFIDRAQICLDGLHRFTASFSQAGSDGPAQGYVWLDRPGRLRVDYVRPRPKLLIANHGRLLLADRLTGATTTMPVANTPLDILLADHIEFSGPVRVTAVQHQPGAFQISAVKAAAPAQGMLTFQFAETPLALLGVVVQDQSGRVNTLTLADLRQPPAIDPAQFTYRPAPNPTN